MFQLKFLLVLQVNFVIKQFTYHELLEEKLILPQSFYKRLKIKDL